MLYRLYLPPVFSYTPTLCASLLWARLGGKLLQVAKKKAAHIVLNIKSGRIGYYIGLISRKRSLYWFAHTDVPLLSPLCSAQSPGRTYHRLFIWRLPAGHGRRPAETASRHLSAGVCQARQETGVSHSNLPMQCIHQWELSEGHKGESGKYSHNTAGTQSQFLAVVFVAWVCRWEGVWGLFPCPLRQWLPLVCQVPAQDVILRVGGGDTEISTHNSFSWWNTSLAG